MSNRKPARGARVNITHPSARNRALDLIMNAGTGKELFDHSRNNRTVDITGATWVNGVLTFDGDGDKATVPDHQSLNFGPGDFTIKVKFKLNAIQNPGAAIEVRNIIIGKGGFNRNDGWLLSIGRKVGENAGEWLNFHYKTPRDPLSSAEDAIVVGVEYDVHITRIGTALKLYLGRDLIDSGTTSNDYNNAEDLLLGMHHINTGPDRDLDGAILDCRLLKRGFSPNEVKHSIDFPYARFERQSPPRFFFVPSAVIVTPDLSGLKAFSPALPPFIFRQKRKFNFDSETPDIIFRTRR